MRKLTYRPLALADLDAIHDITGSEYPERGARFVEDIRARCRSLLITPGLGPARPDLGLGIRIYPVKARRVLVAYRASDEEITVVRVFYGGADYEAVFRDADEPEN